MLFPERKLTHLSTPDEKEQILRATGVDDVWICPFTTEIARLEPEDFIRMVAEREPLAELWVGADFAMGRGRRGTIAVLAEIGSAMGWGLHMVPTLTLEGQVVSSTAIRTLLGAGAVRGAADLLGRNYRVSGEIQGDELVVEPLRTLPRSMAYEAMVHQDASTHETVVTVQPAPGRIYIGEVALKPGPATVEFTRRRD